MKPKNMKQNGTKELHNNDPLNEEKLLSFDFAIKFLLKNKSDYVIIEGFLSAILEAIGYKPIKVIKLLDPESLRENKQEKYTIADILVRDVEGTNYIIEIDRKETTNFVAKSFFNTAKLASECVERGDKIHITKIFHLSIGVVAQIL